MIDWVAFYAVSAIFSHLTETFPHIVYIVTAPPPPQFIVQPLTLIHSGIVGLIWVLRPTGEFFITICWGPMTIKKQWGFFIVPHVLWLGTFANTCKQEKEKWNFKGEMTVYLWNDIDSFFLIFRTTSICPNLTQKHSKVRKPIELNIVVPPRSE